MIFRIPTPLFGSGLLEAVDDQALINNLALSSGQMGVTGHFNHSGNDGTITRFGWKAQNKSLLLFAGEALNVEMGVTNELFPNERTPGANCPNRSFEDLTRVNGVFPGVPLNQGSTDPDIAGEVSSLIENFAIFMRFNGTPSLCAFNSDAIPNPNDPTVTQSRCFSLSSNFTPDPRHPLTILNPSQDAINSIARGAQQFSVMGCDLCHSQQLTTGPSHQLGLSNRTFIPFTDLALHHMGGHLADGITQGEAGPDEFRTAPLWGLGQRIFLLHDGRATNLLDAIRAHSDQDLIDAGTPSCFHITATQDFNVQFPTTTGGARHFTPDSSPQDSCASEANQAISKFETLPDVSPDPNTASKQDVLNYLRSL